MASPYPWSYTLQFPYYFLRPSTRNHTRLGRRPLGCDFMPRGDGDALRIFLMGDIMVMQNDRIPEIDPTFAELLRSADLVIANCESPVARIELRPEARYKFVFDMAEEYFDGILQQSGVPPERWAVSIANNHAGDQGLEGFHATTRYFDKIGATSIGRWTETQFPVVTVRCRGLRIGLVAWTHWVNIDVFRSDPGVWRPSHVQSVQWSRVKREFGFDTLIGFPHWEFEFQHFPRAATRRLAHRLIWDGFDVIAGVHPHVLQPIEWFANGGVCLYSLGNFCGLGVAWPVRLIPVFEILICTGGGRRGQLASYRVHLFAQVNTKSRISIVPLHKAPPQLRERFIQRLGLVFEHPSEEVRYDDDGTLTTSHGSTHLTHCAARRELDRSEAEARAPSLWSNCRV